MAEVPGSILWGNILLLDILFSHNKATDANIALVAKSMYFGKPRSVLHINISAQIK